MKKYLIYLALTMLGSPANAITLNPITPDISSTCSESGYQVCMTGMGITYNSSCSVSACNRCTLTLNTDMGLTNSYGIVVTSSSKYQTNCPSSYGGTATCECVTQYTYKCASGYYGTATSESAGCTKCPSNATCAGENGSTFVCAKGYYKNGSACTACPSSGGVAGTTSSTGATSITSCYIPAGSSFSDVSGSWTYSSNCYYVN